MLRPNEVGAYLDGVRPSMAEIQKTNAVQTKDGYGIVLDVDIDSCLVHVIHAGERSKWIRVEQIEYIHPY